MYKVLLVEDEPIFRLAIKTLIDWNKYNIEIELEASNGKKALEILKNNMDIDIIITDINMPIMNGLELIREIEKMNIEPSIIVLSAYDDYDLVRETFKLGICDYILKRKMEPEQVLQLLLDVINRREKNIQEENIEIINYSKNDVLKNLIEEDKVLNIDENTKRYNIKIQKNNIVVLFIWIDKFKVINKKYVNNMHIFKNGVKNTIGQSMDKIKTGEFINVSAEEYVVLISFDINSQFLIREKLNEYIEMIRHALFHYMSVEITVGVSNIRGGYPSIRTSYLEAMKNARMRYIFGRGKNIYPEDTIYLNKKDKKSIIGSEKKLLQAINDLHEEKVIYELNILLDLIGSFKSESINEIIASYMELVFIIIKYLNEIDQDASSVFNHSTDFYNIIKKFETKYEVDNWIRNIVKNIVTYLVDQEQKNLCDETDKVIKYINENYKKNITFKDVCEYVHLSEGYFSRVFSNEVGDNFTNYLTKLRIDKSTQLIINSDMKIYEICESVGYRSVEHFSRTFKKMMGMSPKKFKKLRS